MLLAFSIALDGRATLVGLLPTYAQVEPRADRAGRGMRVVQGFSLGGGIHGLDDSHDDGHAIAARPHGQLAGGRRHDRLHLGSRRVAVSGSTSSSTIAWRWRIPFVASVLLCIGGCFLRRGLAETAEGIKADDHSSTPLVPSLIADWRPMVQTFGIGAMTNAAYT